MTNTRKLVIAYVKGEGILNAKQRDRINKKLSYYSFRGDIKTCLECDSTISFIKEVYRLERKVRTLKINNVAVIKAEAHLMILKKVIAKLEKINIKNMKRLETFKSGMDKIRQLDNKTGKFNKKLSKIIKSIPEDKRIIGPRKWEDIRENFSTIYYKAEDMERHVIMLNLENTFLQLVYKVGNEGKELEESFHKIGREITVEEWRKLKEQCQKLLKKQEEVYNLIGCYFEYMCQN